MNADNHQPASNDADLNADIDLEIVEISDIPALEEDDTSYRSAISGQIARLGKHLPERRRTWRWLMSVATCFLLLGLLFSNLSALRSSILNLLPASTPTPAPVTSNSILMPDTTPGVIGPNSDRGMEGRYVTYPVLADAAPQNCGAVPTVTASREVGKAPVWLYGFDGPRATIHLHGFSQPIVHNVYGWPIFIQLMVKDRFTLPVTLSGGNLRNGPTIFFAFYPGERPMDSIILGTQGLVVNPIQPETGQRAVWIATMFLFSSGCYTLTAAWPGGRWTVNFAAGR